MNKTKKLKNYPINNIGIYGDSFAIDSTHSWINYLRKLLNSEIISYGDAGTDMVYSYHQFLKNYKKHDFNIFVMTDPTRDHIWENSFPDGMPVYRKQLYDSKQDRIIQKGQEVKIAFYPMSWYYRTIAIVDSLNTRDPRILIINALNGEYSQSMLLNLQKLDGDRFDGIENDNRPCHLSRKQNQEFAEYLHRYFLNGFEFNETLLETTVNKYYTKSKNKEEAGYD